MADKLEIQIVASDKASAELAKVDKSLGQLGKTTKTTGTATQQMAAQIKAMATQFGATALAGFGAYKAVSAVGDFFKSSINDTMEYAKSVRDVSRFLGTSSEEASKLIQIADDLEIDVGALKQGFRTAAREGILPTIDGLKGLAAQYKQLATPTEKARFAMEKFGRAGLEMQKFLELAPEQIDEMAQSAEDLGLVLDQEAIAKTEEYRLAMDNLGDAAMGLKVAVGTELIPTLTGLITSMTSGITEAEKWNRLVEDGIVTQEEMNRVWGDADAAAALLAEKEGLLAEREAAAAAQAQVLGPWVRDVGAAMEEAAEDTEEEIGAVDALAQSFDTAKASGDLLREGMKLLSDTVVDAERFKLNLAAATGTLTQAELDQRLEALQLLQNQSDLNQAMEDGTISEMDYFRVMADGKVTSSELNEILGYTPGQLTAIQEATGLTAEQWAKYSDTSKGKLEEVNEALQIPRELLYQIKQAIIDIPSHKKVLIEIEERRRKYGGGGGGIPEMEQHGGPVYAGRSYIVGEAGPEPFIPAVNGRILSNAEARQALAEGAAMAASTTNQSTMILGGLNLYGVSDQRSMLDELSRLMV